MSITSPMYRRASIARSGARWLARALILLGLLLAAGTAGAEPPADLKRTALVVGNAGYDVGGLRNPANDARGMAKALEGLGFGVILRVDANRRGLEDALLDFKRRLQRRGGVGLFYYAGHGLQSRGHNYLIPVGARIRSEADVRYRAVDAGLALEYMEEAQTQLNIVILDACRDNPYERSFRSAGRGLARMEVPRGELGSLIAYSTAPGARQLPWSSDSLLENFYLAGGGTAPRHRR